MARIMPAGLDEARLAGSHSAEIDTLEWLAHVLPDDYAVFHSVHWMAGDARRFRFGETDFLVVNQSGDVLLIEQKNGPLEHDEKGLAKCYGHGRPKSVIEQINRSRDHLLNAWQARHASNALLAVQVLLYCPDHRVENLNAAGLAADAIVDAARREELVERIEKLLGPGIDRGDGHARLVRDFLAQSLSLRTDLGATVERHDAAAVSLSGGLLEVIDGLEMDPFRLCVHAAAGSGKTQVAAHFYQRAIERGRKPLFLCFNRPLADRLRSQLDTRGVVDTFHGFCVDRLQAAGRTVDFNREKEEGSAFWKEVEEQLIEATREAEPFDALVIDEGQDFDQSWWDILGLVVDMDSADILWVEDESQRLYDRRPVELAGFVHYRSTANFRNPVRVVRFIEQLFGEPVDGRNPLPGMHPGVHVYRHGDEQRRLLGERVEALVAEGFRQDQIAVISVHGLQKGALAEHNELNGLPVRRFTGRYDEDSHPIFTRGELLHESIFRFKGQHAPAVLITDIDHSERNEQNTRRLYCALTRAKITAELFVHADSVWRKPLQKAAR